MSVVRWNWNVNQNLVLPSVTTEATAPKVPDNYWQKLVKIIPTEVVGGYTALDSFARAVNGQQVPYLAVAFLLCLVLVPIAMVRLRKVQNVSQIALALAAYVIWVYAQGGVFSAAGCLGAVCYQAALGGFVALAFVIVVAIYNPNV